MALGHRDIAHIDGGDTLIAELRRSGYVAAMRRHGLADRIRVEHGGQSQIDAQPAARRLSSDSNPPTALIAYNDDIAVGAMGVFERRGVAVPEQISIVGYDDSVLGQLAPVPLTSVAQRPDELGRLAVERMIARVERRRVGDREIVLGAELKVRASTAVPPPARRLPHNGPL